MNQPKFHIKLIVTRCINIFLLLATILFSFQAISQKDSTTNKGDSIIVIKDARLDILMQKQIAYNRMSQKQLSNGLYKGFRLQLLSSNNRNLAFKLKYNLMSAYPDYKAYVVYQAPYFKVRLGNFIKRESAEKARVQISKSFNTGIFIVEDAIEYVNKNEEATTLK